MTEVKVETRPKSKGNRTKAPAYAAFVTSPYGSKTLYADAILPTLAGQNEPDKMVIPTDFHSRVALVRYFYELDPIANTVVDKIVEISISKLILDRNECTDDELSIYTSVKSLFEDYLREAALEYLLSGLVVPQVSWEDKTPKELGISLTRRIKLPAKSWVLDPAHLELKRIPMTPQVGVVMRIPPELKSFINEKGVLNGYKDIELYRFIVEHYPEVIGAIRRGESRVVLDNAFLIRRRNKTYDPYPTPYLLAALESLAFKRNLKKMDYSVASRVISAIQLIKLGNDEYPITEDDDDLLEDLKKEMLWRNNSKNIDRVFQLFANHTLEIDWIFPDTDAMLNREKYEAVNQDIFYALGFPRILVSGETARSATSQAEFAMFSPAESMKRLRDHLLTWVDLLIDKIQEENNLEHKVMARFEELRLYDISKLATVAALLYENNALSLTSLANSAGYDFDKEAIMKKHEREVMEEYEIPEFPPKPFSPKPDIPGKEDRDTQKVSED